MDQSGSTDNLSLKERIQSAELLFAQHGNFIHSVIRFFVRDEFEREDVYQELFVFFINKPVPEDIRNLKGYLYRVVADRIKDLKRKQVRYRKRLERYAEMADPVNENETGSFLAFSDREMAEKVYSLLEQHLTENEAAAINLRYKENSLLSKINI